MAAENDREPNPRRVIGDQSEQNDHRGASSLEGNGGAASPADVPTLPSTDDRGRGETEPRGETPPGPPPVRFGNYEILRELGRGGMGVVFQARQRSLDRVVALKKILAGDVASGEARERFLREARTAAALRHPNIVQVYDLGEIDGQTYFAMEYVDGPNLSAVEAMPPRRAAEIVEQIARAVHHAHQSGVIHRDLKPANVLLDPTGVPKVTDFGIAKWMQEENVSRLTSDSQLLGTAPYMPPEQARGEARSVGPEADVYGLGAILYQLLTTQPPFLGRSIYQILERVQNDPPWPPRRLAEGIPLDLDTIVLRCLEKSPARRYSTAEALADDLARLLRGEPIAARPVGPVRRSLRWLHRSRIGQVALVALLVATCLGGWRYVRYARLERPTIRFYRNLVLQQGEPTGVDLLSPDQVARRHASLEFTYRGSRGRLDQIRSLHSSGNPVPSSVLSSALDGGRHDLNKYTVACWSISRDAQGEITKITARDRLHDEIWSFLYTRFPTKGHYVDRHGNERSKTGTGATYLEFTYGASGFSDTVRYFDATGSPRVSREGRHGYALQTDDQGRTIRMTNLDTRGKPLELEGYVHQQQQFDDTGNLRRIDYRSDKEQPAWNAHGIAGIEYDHDDAGNMIASRCIDLDGKPVTGVDGYAIVKRELDSRGNATRQRHFDAQGQPTSATDLQVAEVERVWDNHGNLTREVYRDVNGEITTCNLGYARVDYGYNPRGYLTDRAVFDVRGNPALDEDGIHRMQTIVDDDGRVMEYAYFDVANHPTRNSEGVSRLTFQYDDRGHRVATQYLDPAGKPTAHRNGTAGWRGEYDPQGNLVRKVFLGVDGRPAVTRQGHAITTARFDPHGNLVEEAFLDADEKPTVGDEGWHRMIRVVDERHVELERRFFDTENQPTWHVDGYSGFKLSCDARGNVLDKQFVNPQGELTRSKEGYARYVARYDHRGLVLEESFWDENRRPTINRDGASRIQYEWNPQGFLTRKTTLDLAGRPISGTRYRRDRRGNLLKRTYLDGQGLPREMDGVATFVWAYNERGQEIEMSTYDARGEKKRRPNGIFRETYAYDRWGRWIDGRSFDEDGQPAPHKDGGHARITKDYDERGNLIREAYFDIKNRPFLNGRERFASFVAAYDSFGNRTEFRLLGVDGEPIISQSGYHCCREVFERGKPRESTYFGIDGERVMTSAGFSRVTRVFDERLLEIEKKFFDEKDQLVREIGWAEERKQYDARGNCIRIEYYDHRGEPALGNWGYSIEQLEYDRWNRPISVAHFIAPTQPALRQPEGYWRRMQKYDPFGNVVQERFFGIDGEPVATRQGYAEWTEQFTSTGCSRGRQYFDIQGKPLAVRVTVTQVGPGSPAERHNVQVGDVLVRLADEPVSDARQFLFRREELHEPEATVLLERDGKSLTVALPAGELGVELEDVVKEVANPSEPN